MPDALRRARELLTSRLIVRTAFLLYFVWACWRLTRFATWARGQGGHVPRPEAVAGILPIGHFTSFFAWVKGGGWDTMLPAGLVIIIAALTVSLLFRRAFCGWICPVGTVWELAAQAGRRLLGRNVRLPRWLDLAGRAVRYALAGVVFAYLASVPLAEAVAFRSLPYMWVADIKIIEGFLTPLFAAVIALTFVVSMLLGPVWCRWLCPLGGLYSLVGLASPLAVRRDAETCIHCSRCNETCHAFIDVEAADSVRGPECDGCMDCVRVCPVDGCLEARGPAGLRIAPWVWPLLVVGVWIAIWAGATLTGNWKTTVPDEAFREAITSGLLEERTPGFLD